MCVCARAHARVCMCVAEWIWKERTGLTPFLLQIHSTTYTHAIIERVMDPGRLATMRGGGHLEDGDGIQQYHVNGVGLQNSVGWDLRCEVVHSACQTQCPSFQQVILPGSTTRHRASIRRIVLTGPRKIRPLRNNRKCMQTAVIAMPFVRDQDRN